MITNQNLVTPKHFYSLDAIRGVASIIVVLYHWQLFFCPQDVFVPGADYSDKLPGYRWLSFFYDSGMVSVDLFFALSGFIFFWLYADKVAARTMSFSRFLMLRLSRLYPLHFVLLLTVAWLQWLMLQRAGHYFVVPFNDMRHFILHLFFIQSWGFEEGHSFNGPAWSVSVEIFLYLLFFVICWCRLQRNRLLLLLLIPVGAIMQHYGLITGKGMFSFFIGALVYYIYQFVLQQQKRRTYLTFIIVLTVLLWCVAVTEHYYHFLHPWLDLQRGGVVNNLLFRVTVSPCTILSLALLDTFAKLKFKLVVWLGNSSYALYLLHFPLQIVCVLMLDYFHISRNVMEQPLVMCLFFLVLIPMSGLTYYYFELPVQERWRYLFNRKRNTVLS
ncbi:acyltransferase family protein [Chitinophaga vietnamensis]|uniref:acyltransferase family protein n=1 Tax=Chitinophaga vietnamensis TaxID=2593957 RepID=UPI0011787787|nr:acyltransferase [Chitinophaga vietnamensis]